MRSVWPCLLADYMCMCSMNESQKLREHHQTHLIKEDYRKKKTKNLKYRILFMHQEKEKKHLM